MSFISDIKNHSIQGLGLFKTAFINTRRQIYQLQQAFDQMMQSEYQLTSSLHSQRFSLTKNNLGYKLQREGICKNTFVLRPSSDIINFQNNKLLLAFRIAMLLSEQLDDSKGITDDDVEDFKDTCYGYKEKKEDNDKKNSYGKRTNF